MNEISAFPLDSYVQISSGEIGRVVATDPGEARTARLDKPFKVDALLEAVRPWARALRDV